MTTEKGRGRGERAGLGHDAIVAGALALSREVDADRFSVRLLAARLGVDPMAIHYWFRGRELLLDATAAQALRELPGLPAGQQWDATFRATASDLWAAVTSHPGVGWAARRLDLGQPTAFSTGIQESIAAAGLPDRDAITATLALYAVAVVDAEARDEARFRSGVSLILDGLRMRVLERRAAAGAR